MRVLLVLALVLMSALAAAYRTGTDAAARSVLRMRVAARGFAGMISTGIISSSTPLPLT